MIRGGSTVNLLKREGAMPKGGFPSEGEGYMAGGACLEEGACLDRQTPVKTLPSYNFVCGW